MALRYGDACIPRAISENGLKGVQYPAMRGAPFVDDAKVFFRCRSIAHSRPCTIHALFRAAGEL
jgi:hypothetical protein